jgi:hypothetical protein
MERLMPTYRQAQQRMGLSAARGIALRKRQGMLKPDQPDVRAFLNSLSELAVRYSDANANFSSFYASASQLPPAAAAITKAGRRMKAALGTFLAELGLGEKMIQSITESLQEP